MKFLLLLAIPLVAVAFQDYTPDTYPDSFKQPMACEVPEPGFLCDPNNLLSNSSKLAMIHKLVKSQKETPCVCGELKTNLGSCDSEKNGFIISVALVNKMVLNEDERDKDHVLRAAELFADTVRQRQNRGHCQDDILIFISAYDKVTFTSVGSTTQQNLTDELITSISTHADNFFFKDGKYEEGLDYLIDTYTSALRGEKVKVTETKGWYWPVPLWALITIFVVGGLIILALIGLCIFCCVKKCKKDNRGTYQMGSRL